jgi:hypothetical protein
VRQRGKVIEGSTKEGIYEVNFGYNVKMEVYANSSLDIPELSKILLLDL